MNRQKVLNRTNMKFQIRERNKTSVILLRSFCRAIFLQYVRAPCAADVYENSRDLSALPPGWPVRRSAGFPACLLVTLVRVQTNTPREIRAACFVCQSSSNPSSQSALTLYVSHNFAICDSFSSLSPVSYLLICCCFVLSVLAKSACVKLCNFFKSFNLFIIPLDATTKWLYSVFNN